MARPPTRPAIPPAPAAPLPTTLLSGPRVFAAQLRGSEPRWWRYAGVIVLSSVLSGVAYALVVRHAAAFAARAGAAPPPGLSSALIDVLGGTFLGFLTFALMWGLGRLGAGREGRAAEVFGASFALLPPLWLLVIVWTLLTPAGTWQPGEAAIRAAGTDAVLLQQAGLKAAAQTQAAALLVLVSLLGTVAQSALAGVALAALTGRPARAALGSILPLLPALAAQFVGVAPLVISALRP